MQIRVHPTERVRVHTTVSARVAHLAAARRPLPGLLLLVRGWAAPPGGAQLQILRAGDRRDRLGDRRTGGGPGRHDVVQAPVNARANVRVHCAGRGEEARE